MSLQCTPARVTRHDAPQLEFWAKINALLAVTQERPMGISELLVVFLIMLVVFGGSRLPGVAHGIGRGIRNFKDAIRGDRRPDD